ncbi:MAG TPA: ABC transporter permease [Gemmatimonadaceae bacterium]|nr:ABC transporter permease [Gemmatimonadaceae bacterium]
MLHRSLSLDIWRENFGIAVDALRVSKLRSGLTILGVVIGVSTVMTMASIVQGIQKQITNAIEVAGPTTFYVMKVFNTSPVNPDRLPKWIRVRPDLTWDEAQRIAELPQVYYAGIWAQVQARLEYRGERTQPTIVTGADEFFPEIQGGELSAGRWFTRSEIRSGAAVAVIQEQKAMRLFGRIDPIGKTILVGGRPVEVIGLYVPPQNIFAPPGTDNGAIMPFRYVYYAYNVDKTNAMFIAVKPKPGVSVADAQEAVTITLREMRRLRPADKNSFDMITQDQILDTFNSITGTFFVVMIVLASVALLVGGIGVMAIMMVSVTARTREIGVRKAMGATRRDILLQFLIEAATLTGIGGAIGIVLGLLVGRGVSGLMSIQAEPPFALTAIAVLVSVGIGVVFGVIPARRAARLDPVDALRYE